MQRIFDRLECLAMCRVVDRLVQKLRTNVESLKKMKALTSNAISKLYPLFQGCHLGGSARKFVFRCGEDGQSYFFLLLIRNEL